MNIRTFFRTRSSVWLTAVLCVSAIGVPLMYALGGYSPGVAVLWIVSLLSGGAVLWHEEAGSKTGLSFNRNDAYAALALAVLFVPLYAAFLYDLPLQVNSDEIVISTQSENITAHERDIFSLSGYFRFPSLIFIVYGSLAQFLGGVELTSIRLIHAMGGLATVLTSYLLFRFGFRDRFSAFCAAVVLGASHSLIAISRMAMRDNTPLLFEVIAATLLLWGLASRRAVFSYAAGVFAGLGFYTYYPSRMIIVLLLLYLAALYVFWRREYSVRLVTASTLSILAGFVFTVSPLAIATLTYAEKSEPHQSNQLLITEEGRQLQKEWVGAESILEGMRINLYNGLTAFNLPHTDQGYIYPNEGHGFVDPITGALLWIGVLSIAIFHRNPRALFFAGAFALLYLIFAFVVNKAPNYTRMLIILPFVAYAAVVGLNSGVRALASPLKRVAPLSQGCSYALVALGVASIVAWNGFILADYAIAGMDHGGYIGSTGRYIDAHPEFDAFYVLADEKYPYYWWGSHAQWIDWTRFFAENGQEVIVAAPAEFPRGISNAGLFLSDAAWTALKDQVLEAYPRAVARTITPDGALLVVEVPPEGV